MADQLRPCPMCGTKAVAPSGMIRSHRAPNSGLRCPAARRYLADVEAEEDQP